jgi:hypothetical protein
LLFIAGMLVAVALVAFAGIAFALSQNKGGSPHGNGNTAQVGTATPAPTKAPTQAPTTVPTIAPTPQPTNAPANQPGFVAYTGDPNWTIQYPNGTNVQTGSISQQGIPVLSTTFATRHSQFEIFDLPVQVPSDQAQGLLNQIAAQLGAQDIQILSQGSVQHGANTWQSLHIRATANDTHFEAILLYTTHNSGSTIINMSAPVKNFGQANDDIFQPMIQSFAYTS